MTDPTIEDLEALDNILASHRRGYHFVTTNRSCLDFLSKLNGLSLLCRKQLQMINFDYSTLSEITRQVATKIVVKPPNYEFKRTDTVINNSDIIDGYQYKTSTFEISLREFIRPEILDKTRLISEHIDDCYFYEFIGARFSTIRNLPCSLTFDHVHGGGNDTYKIFKDKIEKKNIVFTLVDSDKREPAEDIGATGKQVVDIYETYKENSIINCEVLPVHEKENLFSTSIYENFGNNIRNCAIEQYKILETFDDDCRFIPYIDIKEGLHSGNYLPYFEGLFDIPNLIPRSHSESRNFDNEYVGTKEEFLDYYEEQKNLPKRDRNKKYLIEPLGSNPLGNFELEKLKDKLSNEISQLHPTASTDYVQKLENKLKILKDLADYLLEFQKEYFKILGTQIKEWGLSNPKRSA